MFNLGVPEVFFLLVLALIFVGPKRLPEIGKAIGGMLAELRKATTDLKSGLEKEVDLSEIRKMQDEATAMRREIGELAAAPGRILTREVESLQQEAAAPDAPGPAAEPAPLDPVGMGLTDPERPTREERARAAASPAPGATPEAGEP